MLDAAPSTIRLPHDVVVSKVEGSMSLLRQKHMRPRGRWSDEYLYPVAASFQQKTACSEDPPLCCSMGMTPFHIRVKVYVLSMPYSMNNLSASSLLPQQSNCVVG